MRIRLPKKRHAKTESHLIKSKGLGKEQRKISSFTKYETEPSYKERVKVAEIKLVGFLVDHNVLPGQFVQKLLSKCYWSNDF